MKSLNKVMIIGNLTRDPEIRSIPNGQNVAHLGVATNFTWVDTSGQKQQKVEFHNIVAWRGLADVCSQYLHKGDRVYIEGRLQTRNWEGQDGIKRNRTEIIANDMVMLGSARGVGAEAMGETSESSSETVPEEQQNPSIEESISQGKSDEKVSMEDIPF